MEQPKKELKLTPEEVQRLKKIRERQDTPEFKETVKNTQGVKVENGKAEAITQKRKIQVAKPGSGKNTRVIGEDGSVIYEAQPGSKKEKEMLLKLKRQEADTNFRRKYNADVVNYQLGEEEGNKVYDKKLAQQK